MNSKGIEMNLIVSRNNLQQLYIGTRGGWSSRSRSTGGGCDAVARPPECLLYECSVLLIQISNYRR